MTTPKLEPVMTQDSWVNPATGVGSAADKIAGFAFVPGTDRLWSTQLLGELYEVDDICATIVDALPQAAFERGWRFDSDLDAEAAERVRDAIDHYRVQEQLLRTRKWARLFGGAALYIGSDDGPQEAPLQYGGRLHFLHAYEQDELQPSRYYDDPLSPRFGEPSHYRLTPIRSGSVAAPTLIIHESRLVVMHGVDTTNRKRAEHNGWGSSVLIRPMKPVQQFYGAFAISLSLLGNSSQDIYKWKGLADLLLAGKEEIIEARMRLIDRVRSSIHAIALDADEEDFVRSQINLPGVDAILDKFALRVAAAARMPMAVLFGQAPAGLNATGESDLRNWYSQVEVEKREEFTPALERILRVMLRAKNGPTAGVEPGTWSVKFASQWSPTPREEAEIRSINAQTDQVYVDLQVLKPSQIARARFTGDTEQQAPLVTTEDIEALEAAERMSVAAPEVEAAQLEAPADAAPGGASALSGALTDGSADDVTTEDDAAPSAPSIDETIAAIAAKMTEHGVDRCEHGIVNRCIKCGIERVRDFDLDPEGRPVWRILWRPIGAPGFGAAPVGATPDDDDPDDADA